MLKSGDITIEDSERQPCEIWCRVMGYYQVTTNFNIGKRGEFNERVWFTEAGIAHNVSQPAQISIISPPGIPAVIPEL